MKVSAQYAEEHFADILHAADNGEEVEIARPDKPVLLLATRPVATSFERKNPRVLGAGRGKIVVPSWEEWKAMDKEIEREMCDAPFITTGEI
jgi:antitoxin (DNA-binding transcriptional repressor) of toxin-antitoxin stability system